MAQGKKYDAPKASLERVESQDILMLSPVGKLDLDTSNVSGLPGSYWGDGVSW